MPVLSPMLPVQTPCRALERSGGARRGPVSRKLTQYVDTFNVLSHVRQWDGGECECGYAGASLPTREGQDGLLPGNSCHPEIEGGVRVIQCVLGKGSRQHVTGMQVRNADCYGNAGTAEPRKSGASAPTPTQSKTHA